MGVRYKSFLQNILCVLGALGGERHESEMTVKGKGWVYYKPGDVRVEERTFSCGPDQLLVKVLMSARCGTDRTIFRKGHARVNPYAPVILGHELVAEIVEVGKGVSGLTEGIGYRQGTMVSAECLDFKPGERLTFQGRVARYRDGLMLIPDPIANLSFRIDAGHAQYMTVPATMLQSESVLRVPPGVSDEAATLAEPAACALESIFATPHAVSVDGDGRHLFRAGIWKGGRTCVIGSGTVSMIYALLARHEGARQVILIVRSEQKARTVRDMLGSEFQTCLSPVSESADLSDKLAAERELVEKLSEMTKGELFDDVVCACADPDAQRLMLELYAPEGYAVGACFGGTHETVERANMDLHHYRAARTIGTSGCSTDAMKTVLRWLTDGSLKLEGLVDAKHWTFEDDPHDFYGASGSLKPVLYPWE